MDEDPKAAIARWFRAGAGAFEVRPDKSRAEAFDRLAVLIESGNIDDIDLEYLISLVKDGEFRPDEALERRLTHSTPPAGDTEQADRDFIADVTGPLRPL